MNRFTVGLLAGLAIGAMVGVIPWLRSTDFAVYAVSENRADLLRLYFFVGGNPNVRTAQGSLAYVATGPNGGDEVLKILLSHGTDPNLGLLRWTPLMNAASWCARPAVQILIAAHADPYRRNERGEMAIDTVCSAPQSLRSDVTQYLRSVMDRQPSGN